MITIKTEARTQLLDITSEINQLIREHGISEGGCFLYVPHTTAAVTINESADPAVKNDIEKSLDKLIPWKDGYAHMEGNSAAHIKSSLMGASEIIAIENGRLSLGTWQGVFFCEFDGPRARKIHLRVYESTDLLA